MKYEIQAWYNNVARYKSIALDLTEYYSSNCKSGKYKLKSSDGKRSFRNNERETGTSKIDISLKYNDIIVIAGLTGNSYSDRKLHIRRYNRM